MNEAVDRRNHHGVIAEQWEMPSRLTGESLRSGSLTRIIPFMATASRSAIDALDADPR
jgi:hypothetical protein